MILIVNILGKNKIIIIHNFFKKGFENLHFAKNLHLSEHLGRLLVHPFRMRRVQIQ